MRTICKIDESEVPLTIFKERNQSLPKFHFFPNIYKNMKLHEYLVYKSPNKLIPNTFPLLHQIACITNVKTVNLIV